MSKGVNVVFLCQHNVHMADSDKKIWFVARTRHSQEMSLSEKLAELDVEQFVPTRKEFRIRRGKRVRIDVPAIPNMVFLRATKEYACSLANGYGLPLYYIVDHTTCKMLEVPDKQMDDFRRTVELLPDSISTDVPIVPGQKVRVISGELAGVEGEVLSTPEGSNLVVAIGRILCARVHIKASEVEPIV